MRSVLGRGEGSVIVMSRTCVSFTKESTVRLVSGCSGLVIARAFSGTEDVTNVQVKCTVSGPSLVHYLGSIGCSFGSCAVGRATLTYNIRTIGSGMCFRRKIHGVIRAER